VEVDERDLRVERRAHVAERRPRPQGLRRSPGAPSDARPPWLRKGRSSVVKVREVTPRWMH
jgi:hypothetical protein